MFLRFRHTIVSLIILCTVYTLIPAHYSYASVLDNPGGDETDETFKLGDALYPARLEEILPNFNTGSKVAILDSGFSREAALFMGLYLPVKVVSEKDFIATPSSISLLVIPTGGLSSLKEPERVKTALNRFVEDGGNLFVFCQRLGKDYSLLPVPSGESLKGYGWLEDQSSVENSAILFQDSTIVSGIGSSKPHINIDGFFTVYPRSSKIAINKRVNGQPVFLLYKSGKGNVMASTFFTDWAYMHLRSTWDEISIFNGMLKLSGIAVTVPALKRPGQSGHNPFSAAKLPPLGFSVQSDNEIYNLGEKAVFTIIIWNNEDKRRTIEVYYDQKGQKVMLNPHTSSQITYSMPVFSTRRLWVYFYDENEIFLQTLKRGYIVVYPESAENKQ
ncbi:MAG: hypothetical protein PH343_02605 [Nitrospira sp.]|nr:hypothetical protein [Nitrospira sp.]